MRILYAISIIFLTSSFTTIQRPEAGRKETRVSPILLDDFESYTVNGLPIKWRYIDNKQKFIPVTPAIMSEDEYFVVLDEKGNHYLRAYTKNRAHRLIMPNGEGYQWNTKNQNRISWKWRANHLPKGAREDKKDLNDSGGAVYVTFSRDWLGRPQTIKYSYSSTLPIGSTATYGKLVVVVVGTARDGIGAWKTVERNLAADYKKYFGGTLPDKPVSIMLWSDSNSTADLAIVDFDDIRLLPASK